MLTIVQRSMITLHISFKVDKAVHSTYQLLSVNEHAIVNILSCQVPAQSPSNQLGCSTVGAAVEMAILAVDTSYTLGSGNSHL